MATVPVPTGVEAATAFPNWNVFPLDITTFPANVAFCEDERVRAVTPPDAPVARIIAPADGE